MTARPRSVSVLSLAFLSSGMCAGCVVEPVPQPAADVADRFGEAPFLSPGCSHPLVPSANSTNHVLAMTHGPSPRDYRVVLPPGFDRNAPHAMVMQMHQCSGSHLSLSPATAKRLTAEGIPTISVGPSSAVADARGDGNGQGSDGRKCWNLNTEWYDVGFVDQLVERVLDAYCIDTRNVFVQGGSSGGFAAQAMGCYVGATAIAADRGGIHHSNASSPDFPDTPPPSPDACGPIPALLGFARQDTSVPFDQFGPIAVDFWQHNNGCEATTAVDPEAEAVVCDGNLANCECLAYQGCDEPLVVCQWDGNHTVHGIRAGEAGWWFNKFVDHTHAGPDASSSDGTSSTATSTTGDAGTTTNASTTTDASTSAGDETGLQDPCDSLDAHDFEVAYHITPGVFPIRPYCHECHAFGVSDGASDASLIVRWANGLDPRVRGDARHQWIEERPNFAANPFLRIRGTPGAIAFERSTDGTSWITVVSVPNPFAVGATLELFSQSPHLLDQTTCRRLTSG